MTHDEENDRNEKWLRSLIDGLSASNSSAEEMARRLYACAHGDFKKGREELAAAQTKAYRLHAALSSLLQDHKRLIWDTNSEPTFGEPGAVIEVERALYDNRPLADWECAK